MEKKKSFKQASTAIMEAENKILASNKVFKCLGSAHQKSSGRQPEGCYLEQLAGFPWSLIIATVFIRLKCFC